MTPLLLFSSVAEFIQRLNKPIILYFFLQINSQISLIDNNLYLIRFVMKLLIWKCHFLSRLTFQRCVVDILGYFRHVMTTDENIQNTYNTQRVYSRVETCSKINGIVYIRFQVRLYFMARQ